MPSAIADIFRQAAELNLVDDRRKGNVLHVDIGCPLVVTGDIHGYRPGLTGAIRRAALDADGRRLLVLQEIIHGPPQAPSGHDRSIEPLLRAARMFIAHPRQVLFLMGNHDLAQLTGNEISKDGRGACKAFQAGLDHCMGQDAPEVLQAVREFLQSLPLAAKCPGGVFIAHSLPSPKRMQAAGTDILHRPYRPEDLRRAGAAYEWTWGRGHTAEQLDALAATLGVEFFLLGHQHVAEGFRVVSPRCATLASDHAHGCAMEFGSDDRLTAESAAACVRPIAAMGT